MNIFEKINSNALANPANSNVFHKIKDYSEAYGKVLRDPDDREAENLMNICENEILVDPDCVELIRDPLELLYELDKQIETEYEEWKNGKEQGSE